jgi:hypothetical protein
MVLRLFLGISVLIWFPYGLFCFLQPSFLGQVAGVVARSTTATTELRAMYGGLQTGIGLLCLAAFLRKSFVDSALLALAFLCAGLFTARLAGLFIDGSVSGYTAGALLFEMVFTASAIALFRQQQERPLGPSLAIE